MSICSSFLNDEQMRNWLGVEHQLNGIFRDPQQWDHLMGSFPYYSHTTPIRIPKDMGMVWEASHKGVPLLGVPEKFPYQPVLFSSLDMFFTLTACDLFFMTLCWHVQTSDKHDWKNMSQHLAVVIKHHPLLGGSNLMQMYGNFEGFPL